jgi:hypothetical protein
MPRKGRAELSGSPNSGTGERGEHVLRGTVVGDKLRRFSRNCVTQGERRVCSAWNRR